MLLGYVFLGRELGFMPTTVLVALTRGTVQYADRYPET